MHRRPSESAPVANVMEKKDIWVHERNTDCIQAVYDLLQQAKISSGDVSDLRWRQEVLRKFINLLSASMDLRFRHPDADEKAFQVLAYSVYLGSDRRRITHSQLELLRQGEKEVFLSGSGGREWETVSPSQIVSIMETLLDAIARDFDECFSPAAMDHDRPRDKIAQVYREAMEQAVRMFRDFTAELRREYAGKELAAAVREIVLGAKTKTGSAPAVHSSDALAKQLTRKGV